MNIQTPLTQAEQFRINEGVEIGKMACSLYPNGILVNEGSNLRGAEKTKLLMKDQSVDVIFEATFIHRNYIARADIMAMIITGQKCFHFSHCLQIV